MLHVDDADDLRTPAYCRWLFIGRIFWGWQRPKIRSCAKLKQDFVCGDERSLDSPAHGWRASGAKSATINPCFAAKSSFHVEECHTHPASAHLTCHVIKPAALSPLARAAGGALDACTKPNHRHLA